MRLRWRAPDRVLIPFFTVLLSGWLVAVCHAGEGQEGSQSAPAEEGASGGGLFLELGGARDPDLIGGTVGVALSFGRSEVLAGWAFFASDACEDMLTGFALGYQLKAFRNRLTTMNPFLGIGAFGGYSREEVDAEDDHIDNDDDGTVDEDGEKDKRIDDLMFAIYPEAGVHFVAAKHILLSLSARYYLTTKGRNADNMAYLFGVRLMF